MIEPTSKTTPKVKNTHPITVFNWLAKKPIIPAPAAQQLLKEPFSENHTPSSISNILNN